jgi:hypothetical protein
MKVKSFERPLKKALWNHLREGLDRAGSDLTEAILDKISIQGPPRSTPGNPPHKDTTALYEGYTWTVDTRDLLVRIGSDRIYDLYLEEGTDVMAPRPHVKGTLLEHADDLAREICQPMP